MSDLLTKLDDYGYSDYYSFNMPGHKRNYDLTDFFEYYYKHDVTNQEGFDDLHHADGVLAECMKDAARLYGSKESFFLVNGVTSGILSAVSALVPQGGKMLVSRFSERAVYNIATLKKIKLSYIYTRTDPDLGICEPVNLKDISYYIEKENGNFDAVFLTSPTFYGYTSDLKEIADYLHEKKIPLIVDASHGAHFGLADFLPKHANSQGVDVVISAMHVTLPAPTQTGLMHLNGDLVDREKIYEYLRIYQSSSPSYVLMAGLDDCISYLDTGNAADRWQNYIKMREEFNEKVKDLKYLGILDHYSNENIEIGKMIIYSKSSFINGKSLYDRLVEKHHIQPMLVMPRFVLVMFSIFDTQAGFDKFADALRTIDEKLCRKEEGLEDTISLGSLAKLFNVTEKSDGKINVAPTRYSEFPRSYKKMELAEVGSCDFKVINLIDAEGEVSKVYIGMEAQNLTIVAPGEVITKEAIMLINHFKRHGFVLEGLNGDYVEVVRKKQV